MKKLLLVLMISVLGTSSVYAGFLIDPYIGTGSAKTTVDYTGVDDSDDSLSIIGSRVGYSFLLFSAGIDFAKGSIDGDDFTNTSLFVGVDLPILIRAWAEYFISSNLDTDTNLDFKNGTSIGIGFTGLPLVSLNLEVQNINYEVEIGGSDVDVKSAAYIFSVSLPLNF